MTGPLIFCKSILKKFDLIDTVEKEALITKLTLQSTCIIWLITKIFGWRLWTTNRLFPLAPPFDFLIVAPFIHLLLFSVSLLLMFLIIFNTDKKYLLVLLLIAEITSCLFDQSRWQPWEYQFIFIIFIYIVNFHAKAKSLAAVGFLIISTYCYSGLGKFNEGFLFMVWDNMFLRRFFKLGESFIHQNYIYYSGYLLALIELLFGAGLFFLKTQKLSAWLLIAMHIFILLVVGPFPFSLHYNHIVWPWNILMIIHLYLLFILNSELKINLITLWKGWTKLVIIFWGFLPMLNHTFGYWDNFLSSRLFAGVQPQMVLCIKDSTELNQLKPYLFKNNQYNLCDGVAYVNLQKWAMKEMYVPPYIEERVLKKVKEKWMADHKGSSTKAVMYYYTGQNKIKIVPE